MKRLPRVLPCIAVTCALSFPVLYGSPVQAGRRGIELAQAAPAPAPGGDAPAPTPAPTPAPGADAGTPAPTPLRRLPPGPTHAGTRGPRAGTPAPATTAPDASATTAPATTEPATPDVGPIKASSNRLMTSGTMARSADMTSRPPSGKRSLPPGRPTPRNCSRRWSRFVSAPPIPHRTAHGRGWRTAPLAGGRPGDETRRDAVAGSDQQGALRSPPEPGIHRRQHQASERRRTRIHAGDAAAPQQRRAGRAGHGQHPDQHDAGRHADA